MTDEELRSIYDPETGHYSSDCPPDGKVIIRLCKEVYRLRKENQALGRHAQDEAAENLHLRNELLNRTPKKLGAVLARKDAALVKARGVLTLHADEMRAAGGSPNYTESVVKEVDAALDIPQP